MTKADMVDAINEWLDLYFRKKGEEDSSYLRKRVFREYRSIRKTLRKNFRHDADLTGYVEALPGAWVLRSRVVVLIVLTVLLLPPILIMTLNDYIFKIYTGVTFDIRSAHNVDGEYIIIGIIWQFIAVGLIILIIKKVLGPITDRLTTNLRAIERILSREDFSFAPPPPQINPASYSWMISSMILSSPSRW